MNRNTKIGMLAGFTLARYAQGLEDAETRRLLHDLGEHLRAERLNAEAELVGPVLGPQVARGMYDAVKRRDELRARIKSLGALIKRVEFALADIP